jgi:hypothetical protein
VKADKDVFQAYTAVLLDRPATARRRMCPEMILYEFIPPYTPIRSHPLSHDSSHRDPPLGPLLSFGFTPAGPLHPVGRLIPVVLYGAAQED